MTSFLFIFLSLAECVMVERLGTSGGKESKDEGHQNEGLVMINLLVIIKYSSFTRMVTGRT